MRKTSFLVTFAAAATLSLAPIRAVRAQALSIGSAAPLIQVKEWVKGAPVAGFQKGKTYVVEFWATWCGPCRESIPHLTEMQKAHPGVTFVGVSVWEQDQSKVKPFVADMGTKMGYHVAMDRVAAGKEGDTGTMATGWMTAAGQNSIPTAFVINGEGRIAWIGHPMEMEQPLDDVLAGKWDIAAAAADFKAKSATRSAIVALQEKLSTAKSAAEAFVIVNKALSDMPNLEPYLAGLKLNLLLSDPKTMAEATAYLNASCTSASLKDNAQALDALAWIIVNPANKETYSPEIRKAALAAALRANEVTQDKNADIIDTVAAAYFANGDVAKAIENEQHAVSLGAGDPTMTASLARYRAAASTVNK